MSNEEYGVSPVKNVSLDMTELQEASFAYLRAGCPRRIIPWYKKFYWSVLAWFKR